MTKNQLPKWDLSDLYSSPNDKKLTSDLKKLTSLIDDFAKKYQNKIKNLKDSELLKAIEIYEEISDLSAKISGYSYLLHSTNLNDEDISAFYQNTTEKLTDIHTKTLFFSLELNKLDDKLFNKFLESKALAKYKPYLRDLRVFKPYQLSDELEQFILEKSITARNSWIRLFDESLAKMHFKMKDTTISQIKSDESFKSQSERVYKKVHDRGRDLKKDEGSFKSGDWYKELSLPEILHLFSDTNKEIRKNAALTFGARFKESISLYTTVFNNIIKDKQIEDKWRKFKKPISSRNLANLLDDKIVEDLISAVKESYKDISHRYYAYKAKEFGVKKLDFWDRNAPYPKAKERKYTFDEAKNIVLSAYKQFSPKMALIAATFFEKNWIDAAVYKGKDSGAYSHPLTPSVHPYILMNFQGTARDIMTLAHELGHGIHQFLARKQGALLCDTPLTLAETASVFGEQLTFRYLLAQEKDQQTKKYLICSKIEDMINTVIRQIAFCDFETKLHDLRQKQELSTSEICKIWLEVQKESLGANFNFTEEYNYYWAYISHFIHVPFYVYAYAFGDCFVNSLYATYVKQPKGFVDNYLHLLESGGVYRFEEALKLFGFKKPSKQFWLDGLSNISNLINML